MKRPEALDTLREQKGDGSMAGTDGTPEPQGITTVEQRAALGMAGWHPDHDGTTSECWVKDDTWLMTIFQNGRVYVQMIGSGCGIGLSAFSAVAAILGTAPPGYVMVPVEQLSEWAQRLEGTWPNSFTEGDVAEEIRAALKR